MSDDTFIALSGGFDMVHIGHVRMIQAAARFGKVIILLNSDAWLIRKKGKPFMKFEERREILESMFHVAGVIQAFDDDNTVCASIEDLKDVIKYFGNGGDRTHENTPELELCGKYGITPLFGLGGPKVQSSSELIANVQKS